MDSELPAHHAATQRRAEGGARLVLRGVALNLVLAALKIAGGIVGHAYVLIADGAESLLDVLSSLLVWAGFHVAARPPDANHPYGHGKAEALAALTGGVSIVVAAGFIGLHAVHQIVTPHHGPHWATLPLLAAIMLAKFWFSRRLVAAGRAIDSTALGAEAVHHFSDALTSAAAFVGITIGVIGGPGYETADDWAALAACAVIATNGVQIVNRALSDVMDTAVPVAFEADIRRIASDVPGVLALDKVRVRKSGLSYLVDIQVRVDGEIPVRAGHAIAHAVKDALIASPLQVTDVSVHVEPMK